MIFTNTNYIYKFEKKEKEKWHQVLPNAYVHQKHAVPFAIWSKCARKCCNL